MTDSEDESSDEADLEEDAEYEPEEQDEYTDSEGPLSKFGQVESEAVRLVNFLKSPSGRTVRV